MDFPSVDPDMRLRGDELRYERIDERGVLVRITDETAIG